MARAVYISAVEASARAAELGLGFILDLKADSAHALVEGLGRKVRIDEPTTRAVVDAALEEILTAELDRDTLELQRAANRGVIVEKLRAALDANQLFVSLQNPTASQVAAQTRSLTRQMTALIRLAAAELDSQDGT